MENNFDLQGMLGKVKDKIFNDEFKIETISENIEQILNSNFVPVKTGFVDLDNALEGGLFPGTLTLLAAAPSLGKTTIALQIGCSIAEDKRNVLFLALENSGAQNSIKNISRIGYNLNNNEQVSLTYKEIANPIIRNSLENKNKANLEIAIKKYKEINPYFKQISGRSKLTVDQMIDSIIMYMEENNFDDNNPVIIIDYLQQLKHKNRNSSEKEIVDYATESLKSLSIYYNIPIVCLSSIARSHYLEDLELDCGKESGGIEYGADVVIAIQFPPNTGKITDSLIEYYRKQDLKNIELKILKDRFGGASYDRLKFTLIGKYNEVRQGHHGTYFKSTNISNTRYKKEY